MAMAEEQLAVCNLDERLAFLLSERPAHRGRREKGLGVRKQRVAQGKTTFAKNRGIARDTLHINADDIRSLMLGNEHGWRRKKVTFIKM